MQTTDLQKALDLGFPFQNITKSNFWESFIKWIDIVDKNISIYIINNGAATPLPSFKGESDRGGIPLRKSLNCGMGIRFHIATPPTLFDNHTHFL